jgi:YheC/D like ATP-grasp
MYFQFGEIKEKCQVRSEPTLKKNTIMLPAKIGNFNIPTMIPYECRIKMDTIILGPVIGIMGCRRKKDLSKNVLTYLKARLIDYERINGLVFVFAEDDVNTSKKRIKGYYYDAKKQSWNKGIFPLPYSVVISKVSMSSNMYRFFTDTIGENVFYNKHLSKWYQWKTISSHALLSNHVPYTVKLTGVNSILEMLNKFDKVYLKPNKSYQGRGIITIEKREDHFKLQNTLGQIQIFQEEELLRYLNNKIKYKFLIQEAKVFSQKGCLIDFRVYLQKNRNKEWVSPGIMGRIGKEGSIITNVNHRKTALPSYYVFAKYYQLDNKSIIKLQSKMVLICKQIAKLVEAAGNHLGDIAFDVVIDKDLKIWILEFQGGYGAEIKGKNMPIKMYKQMMITPFEYAKTLAGF